MTAVLYSSKQSSALLTTFLVVLLSGSIASAVPPDELPGHPEPGAVDPAYEGDGVELIQYRSANLKVFMNTDGTFTNIIRTGNGHALPIADPVGQVPAFDWSYGCST